MNTSKRYPPELRERAVQAHPDHPINRIDELLPWNVAAALRGNDKPLELAA